MSSTTYLILIFFLPLIILQIHATLVARFCTIFSHEHSFGHFIKYLLILRTFFTVLHTIIRNLGRNTIHSYWLKYYYKFGFITWLFNKFSWSNIEFNIWYIYTCICIYFQTQVYQNSLISFNRKIVDYFEFCNQFH